MKQSAEEIKKWVQVISDDYMHFSETEQEYVARCASVCDFELMPNDSGVIGWYTGVDFDCKKKMFVVLFYCRPELRGRSFIPMLERIEEIAKSENVESICIGDSISGHKESVFAKVLLRHGYKPSGFKKRIK